MRVANRHPVVGLAAAALLLLSLASPVQAGPMSGESGGRMTVGSARAGGIQSASAVVPQAFEPQNGTAEQWWRWDDAAGINRNDAHQSLRSEVRGSHAVVAVIATGTTYAHPGLGSILPGYDFASGADNGDGDGWDSDPRDTGACGGGSAQWHGTAMQGIINGGHGSSFGYQGVAQDAKVIPIRAGNDCYALNSDVAAAIKWAAGVFVQGVPPNPNPADVIVLSFQGEGACPNVIQSAITSAGHAAVVAGTTHFAGLARNGYPANCNGVFGVAPTDRSGNLTDYGSVDTELFGVDGFAPGGEISQNSVDGIWVATHEGTGSSPGDSTYEYYQGAHMAAAQVAGAMALLVDAAYWEGVDPTRMWLETQIEANDRAVPGSCGIACPEGLLDVRKAARDVINYFADGVDRAIEPRSFRFPSTIAVPIAITDVEQVEQPKVRVVLTHPDHAALRIYLTSPGGADVITIKEFNEDAGSGMRSWSVNLSAYVSTPAEVEGEWRLYVVNKSYDRGTFSLLQFDF